MRAGRSYVTDYLQPRVISLTEVPVTGRFLWHGAANYILQKPTVLICRSLLFQLFRHDAEGATQTHCSSHNNITGQFILTTGKETARKINEKNQRLAKKKKKEGRI